MKQNARQFWFVQIMSLATLVLFASLGTWQLSRGNIKSDIEIANSDNNDEYHDVYLPLENLQSWRYKKITLSGLYDGTKQFLLDNQVRDRTSGYNVLTPFYINKYQVWVLVDRGWVPQTISRDVLPEIEIGDVEFVSISGSVYVPYDEAYSLGGIADGEDKHWPRRIQFVDYQQLSERLGVELQPFTLRLDANEDHGYRRDWVDNIVSSQKHYGYAFQWYAMALAIVVLWWLYSIKPLLKNK